MINKLIQWFRRSVREAQAGMRRSAIEHRLSSIPPDLAMLPIIKSVMEREIYKNNLAYPAVNAVYLEGAQHWYCTDCGKWDCEHATETQE